MKHILLVKDKFSGYTVTVPLARKDHILEIVMKIINQAELNTSEPVLEIVSDNGLEFMEHRLQVFIGQKGITHRKSAAYVPQQNGLVERTNQTILSSARTVLNASGLPKVLWPEAINVAAYAWNRLARDGPSPFEKLFGLRPNISNLRRFGDHVAVLVPERYRSKLDQKGRLMLFVGHTANHNTYRLWSPKENITISCDCIFTGGFGFKDFS